jgi:hypothetical protein
VSIRKLSQALVSLPFVFCLLSSPTSAQSTPGQRLPFVPSRVMQRLDDTQIVTLHRKTNFMARAAVRPGLGGTRFGDAQDNSGGEQAFHVP